MEAIVAENAELQAKIDALRKKLGVPATEETDEKARILQIFKAFDTDGNGVIDKNEFDVLAFKCGSDIEALVPENLEKSFNELQKDGKISFDQFYNWLKVDKSAGASSSSKKDLQVLRLKLQSKAWAKSFLDFKASISKDEGKGDEKKGEAKAEAKGDAKAAASSEGKKEGKEGKLFNFNISLGEFKDARAGIYGEGGDNSKLAAATREEVNCPENVPFFFYIDFALNEGHDEGQVGELVGIIDGLIGMIPWGELPVQVYHSHATDIVDGGDGERVLRITFFSTADPVQVMQQLTGQAGSGSDTRLLDVFKGTFKLELPFALADLLTPEFRFSPEMLKLRLQSNVDVDKSLESKAMQLIQRLPAQLQYTMQTRLAFAKFLRSVDFTLKFSDLADLVEHVPAFDPDDNPFGARPASIQQLKENLSQISSVPIAEMIAAQRAGMGMMAAQIPPPFDQIYRIVQANVKGLRRTHIQLHSQVSRLDVKGLDFGGFGGGFGGGMGGMPDDFGGGGFGMPPPGFDGGGPGFGDDMGGF